MNTTHVTVPPSAVIQPAGFSRPRFRVLLSATACRPHQGSEPGTGWEAVVALAGRHDLTVVTHSDSRKAIEAEVQSVGGALADVKFYYLDIKWLPGYQLLDSSTIGQNFSYMLWQRELRRWLRGRHSEFDVAHHLTFVRYWMAPGIAGHGDLPYVIGPVGGADSSPRVLASSLSLQGRVFEWMRDATRRAFVSLPSLRRAVTGAGVCVATTPATAAELKRLGAKDVRLGSEINSRPESIADAGPKLESEDPIVVCAGRLIEWKAYHLAVEAWARANVPGRLEIFGDGPSKSRLESLVSELGLTDRVVLRGHVPRKDLLRALVNARLFLHPSLHDSGGAAVVEAMQNGVPVVCWDHAGPGRLVGESAGVAVDIRSVEGPRGAVEAMAEGIRRLVTDDAFWRSASNGALERVRSVINTDAYADLIDDCYRSAVSNSPQVVG